MLETLNIRNIAVIDSVEIPFHPGLNILSGETGAGKSIVLEAIALLLGCRANTDLLRADCDEATIEGLFNIAEIPWMPSRLKELGFDSTSGELLIKRTIHRAGRHRIYVNGELATLTILQRLCDGLVDLCSQHEHQSLLKSSTQLDLLDRFGKLEDSLSTYSGHYGRFRSLCQERSTLQEAENERSKRTDFLKFQIKELREAQLQPGEDEQLHQEKQLLQSAEARAHGADNVRELLESEEDGVLNHLRTAIQKARALCQLDLSVATVAEGLERATAEVEEACAFLNRYFRSVDLDPDRLQLVQDRLSLIADLRRKYGATIEEMLANLAALEKEHTELDHVETRLTELTEELKATETELRKAGQKLSRARNKIAEQFSREVTTELKDLKMNNARFSVDLETRDDVMEWGETGPDTIQFLVQTNAGEPAKSLSRIASGGELSRLMLAIRRVISDRGGIGVYLFDEIDAGIGGQTAFQVGKKLKSVAKHNQVICITHIPQVASFADHHLSVRKVVHSGRTLTQIMELAPKDRNEEIARMLGGPQLTKKSLENATELLELARNQKSI